MSQTVKSDRGRRMEKKVLNDFPHFNSTCFHILHGALMMRASSWHKGR